MSRLDQTTEVISLADDLGLGVHDKPVDAVVRFCLQRIQRWVEDVGNVTTITDLESLVTQRLQMVFEEIRSDGDFDRIEEHYATGKGDLIFATMRFRFNDAHNPTYGILIRRKNASADAPDLYVAVIDCRGKKLARRFFTRWHEIAHRLTMVGDMMEPVFRSERDPIEQLMDEIAGQAGFYGPIFSPAFEKAQDGNPLLLFSTVQSVINDAFPDASFQATLCACARQLTTPVIYLEAALGHKAAVKRRINDNSPRLFDMGEPPAGELRAVRVVPNSAALQDGFTTPTNMRVPESSAIHSLFMSNEMQDGYGNEDLSVWADSKGKRLDQRAVIVECRKLFDRVIAIVQPTEPKRLKLKRTHSTGGFFD